LFSGHNGCRTGRWCSWPSAARAWGCTLVSGALMSRARMGVWALAGADTTSHAAHPCSGPCCAQEPMRGCPPPPCSLAPRDAGVASTHLGSLRPPPSKWPAPAQCGTSSGQWQPAPARYGGEARHRFGR